MIGEQLTLHEIAGVPMFPGANIAKWPAWYYEAVTEVAARRRMRQNAEMEAESRER